MGEGERDREGGEGGIPSGQYGRAGGWAGRRAEGREDLDLQAI